jgi:CheY-like chemotaxis protein
MKRLSILIVDDEPLVLKALTRMLGGEYDVCALSSPTEALLRLRAGERWDAVLCDVMMPEMSGFEFARRATLAQPAIAARIALITGGTPSAVQEQAGKRAITLPLLNKPVELSVLRRVLAQLSGAG